MNETSGKPKATRQTADSISHRRQSKDHSAAASHYHHNRKLAQSVKTNENLQKQTKIHSHSRRRSARKHRSTPLGRDSLKIEFSADERKQIFEKEMLDDTEVAFRTINPKPFMKYLKGTMVGKGSYGKVKEGYDTEHKILVAFKEIPFSALARKKNGVLVLKRELLSLFLLRGDSEINFEQESPTNFKGSNVFSVEKRFPVPSSFFPQEHCESPLCNSSFEEHTTSDSFSTTLKPKLFGNIGMQLCSLLSDFPLPPSINIDNNQPNRTICTPKTNTLCLLDCLVDNSKGKCYIVTPMIPSCCSLHDFVKIGGKFSEFQARKVFLSIVNGLDFIHKSNIFHRDLKPENVIMLSESEAVISDLGSSIYHPPGEVEETSCVGTIAFHPPLVSNDGKVPSGFKLDIWAMGICLYYMVMGNYPFSATSVMELIDKINQCEYELAESLSEELSDLIEHILKKDENTRYTIPEILNHPWIELDLQEEIIPLPQSFHDTLFNEKKLEELHSASPKTLLLHDRSYTILEETQTAHRILSDESFFDEAASSQSPDYASSNANKSKENDSEESDDSTDGKEDGGDRFCSIC